MPGAGDPRRQRVAREVVRSRLVERIAGSASSGRSPRALPAPEWHANGREFHATCQEGRDARYVNPATSWKASSLSVAQARGAIRGPKGPTPLAETRVGGPRP